MRKADVVDLLDGEHALGEVEAGRVLVQALGLVEQVEQVAALMPGWGNRARTADAALACEKRDGPWRLLHTERNSMTRKRWSWFWKAKWSVVIHGDCDMAITSRSSRKNAACARRGRHAESAHVSEKGAG